MPRCRWCASATPAGRPQIVALLQPATITAPDGGHVIDVDKAGHLDSPGRAIAKIKDGQRHHRSALADQRPHSHAFRSRRERASRQGAEIATIDPGDEQVWEALRALYLVGQADDLPAIRAYERDLPEMSDRVRQQAVLTDKGDSGAITRP